MADRNTVRIPQLSAECVRDPYVRTHPPKPFSDRRQCGRRRCRKLSQFAGDAIAALRITLTANTSLEAEIDRLSAAVSFGFARGEVRKAPTSK
jgi:hypothetical protein